MSIQMAPCEPQQHDMLFISMPFGLLMQPSIGLELLQAQLTLSGVSSKVLYLTLPFAQTIGVEWYNRIAAGEPSITDQLGEWLFSTALFSHNRDSIESYVEHVLLGRELAHQSTNPVMKKVITDSFIDTVHQTHLKIPAFLDTCIQQILSYQPRIVGFTSLFQQHLASIALAQRLKRLCPEIKILFGGANCEGSMGAETIRQFRFIDAVVSGEADLIIEELVHRLFSHQSIDDLQGVYTANNVEFVGINGHYPNTSPTLVMDDLPYPDYTDYFAQKKTWSIDHQANIVFETSRGCWWGQAHHCTFCGLNGLTMAFRSKSADRALTELLHLQNIHPDHPVVVVDNILDMHYFRTFLPRLAELNINLKLFYEIKANLKKEQVQLLQSAGVTTIQPGIENLSTQILSIMNKGIKAIQNIQLLKWCEELNIKPVWNFLWGFPDEDPTEYAQMTHTLPLLTHLPPPIDAQHIRLDRFSPLFNDAEKYDIADIQAYPSYSYIYPSFTQSSVARMAYYFTYDDSHSGVAQEYITDCAKHIKTWQQVYGTSALYAMPTSQELLIWDFRPVARNLVIRLTGLEQAIYQACDIIQSYNQIENLITSYVGPIAHQDVRAMLQQFIDRYLMIAEGNTYLSLAVLLNNTSPHLQMLESMRQVLTATHKMPDYFRITEAHRINIAD